MHRKVRRKKSERKIHSSPNLREAAQMLLGRQLGEIKRQAAELSASHGTEPIHRLRIAMHRLQEDLQILQPFWEERTLESRKKKLRRVSAILGWVRDGDVFLNWLGEYLANQDHRSISVLRPLFETKAQERAREVCRLKRLLPGWCRNIKSWIRPGERLASQKAAEIPFAKRAARTLRHEWKKFHARIQAFEAKTGAKELHNLRVAAKRLRYSLEACDTVLGGVRPGKTRKKMEEWVEELIKVQNSLGAAHDAMLHAHALKQFLRQQDVSVSKLDRRAITLAIKDRCRAEQEQRSRFDKHKRNLMKARKLQSMERLNRCIRRITQR